METRFIYMHIVQRTYEKKKRKKKKILSFRFTYSMSIQGHVFSPAALRYAEIQLLNFRLHCCKGHFVSA